MGLIKRQAIAGYAFWEQGHMGRKDEAEIVCPECVEYGEALSVLESHIITRSEIDKEAGDNFYFCDRCHHRLLGAMDCEGIEKTVHRGANGNASAALEI